MLGCTTLTQPNMLIVEYCEGGDLKSALDKQFVCLFHSNTPIISQTLVPSPAPIGRLREYDGAVDHATHAAAVCATNRDGIGCARKRKLWQNVIQEYISQRDFIHRDVAGSLWLTPGGYVDNIPSNLGKVRTRGLEINSAYSHEIGDIGTLSMSFVGTYLDKYSVDNGITDPYDCAGLYGPVCSGGGTTCRAT